MKKVVCDSSLAVDGCITWWHQRLNFQYKLYFGNFSKFSHITSVFCAVFGRAKLDCSLRPKSVVIDAQLHFPNLFFTRASASVWFLKRCYPITNAGPSISFVLNCTVTINCMFFWKGVFICGWCFILARYS